jgi:hypothetical protein
MVSDDEAPPLEVDNLIFMANETEARRTGSILP